MRPCEGARYTDMAAASMELTHATKMTGSAKVRTASVEGTATTAEMRTAASASAHMNTAAMTATAAARTGVGRAGLSCQKGRRYDHDFEKASHGFAPRI